MPTYLLHTLLSRNIAHFIPNMLFRSRSKNASKPNESTLRSLLYEISDWDFDISKMLNNDAAHEPWVGTIFANKLTLPVRSQLRTSTKTPTSMIMIEQETYERECLSSWRAINEPTEHVVKGVSKRTSAFLAEKQKCPRGKRLVLLLELHEAYKLVQELDNFKKQLKAAMFNNKLAWLNAFPSIGDVPLGELNFATIQLPFEQLDMTSNELKPVVIRVRDYDFLLPLAHGQRFIFFKSDDFEKCFTMRCTDRHQKRDEPREARKRSALWSERVRRVSVSVFVEVERVRLETAVFAQPPLQELLAHMLQ